MKRPKPAYPSGIDRPVNTGALKMRKTSNPRSPDFVGEVRIDLRMLERIREDGGVIKLGGWRKDSPNNSHVFMIVLEATFWRPGDPTRQDVEKEPDEWEIEI